MKRKNLQIGSVLMAFYVLFMAHGLNINFHLCTENHRLTSSFGDASMLCEHCLGHHHEHIETHENEKHLDIRHFAAKCCCEDFEGEIGFTDQFTFSSEKDGTGFLPFTVFTEAFQLNRDKDLESASHDFINEITTYLLTGRLKTIFFSQLKLNPLVF